jgi:hypothetical protein
MSTKPVVRSLKKNNMVPSQRIIGGNHLEEDDGQT